MATLEKIRSKSVLLLIVIGVALLAFIIGDFFTSGRTLWGNDTTVAVVGDDEIDYQEYAKAVQNVSAAGTAEERAALEQQTLQSLMLKLLTQKEYEKLGLVVTDEELNDAVNGSGQVFANMMVQQMTGGQFASAGQFFEYANNAEQYGATPEQAEQMKQAWLSFEEQLSQALLQRKLYSMVSGTMVANAIDAKYLYADLNTDYNVQYAQKPYTSEPDNNYAVTDDELRAEYDAHKAEYKLDEPSRMVAVISVPVVPSQADEQTALEMINEVVAKLNSQPGLEGLRGYKGFETVQAAYSLDALNKAATQGGNQSMKAFVDSASVGQAAITDRNSSYFQIAKLNRRAVEVDTITTSYVIVDASNPATADSILNLINGGISADSLKSVAGVLMADTITTSLTKPVLNLPAEVGQMISADFSTYKQSFINAELSQAFVADTLGSHAPYAAIYTVTSRKAPQTIVEMDIIAYRLQPSTATVNKLRSDLEAYIAANPTAQAFYDNAAAAGYNCQLTNITPSFPLIVSGYNMNGQPAYLTESSSLGKWALDAKAGDVSGVIGGQATGMMLAGGVLGVFDEYVTLDDPRLRAQLTQIVRNNKKAQALIKQLAGKGTTVEEYAAVMGTEPATQAVNVTRPSIFGSELTARIVTTPKGTFVGPVQGENGVVVYTVTEINTPAAQPELRTVNADFQQRFLGQLDMLRLLLGDGKIENRLNNFQSKD